jgi:glycosyltransferase involved in cell wall biosynthesis
MKLSIIIPVYNEERTIFEVLRRVDGVKLPRGIVKEIIVVDDGSEDTSKYRIQDAKSQLKIRNFKFFQHKKNHGKGAAVKTGLKHATGDFVLIQDADLEYDPKDYSKLLKPIIDGKNKVVYGSRLKHYPLRFFGKGRTPFVTHYLGNKFLTFVTRLLYGNGVSDMETGYKVLKREVLEGIEIAARRFDFEPEITAKIMKRGYKIYEVPIKVNPRGYDEGKKISWKDGFIALWTLLKYRFFD